MFIAIFRFLGLVAILAVFVVWVITLVNSDGHCYLDDCDGCPFKPEDCPEKERIGHEERNEEDK